MTSRDVRRACSNYGGTYGYQEMFESPGCKIELETRDVFVRDTLDGMKVVERRMDGKPGSVTQLQSDTTSIKRAGNVTQLKTKGGGFVEFES